MTYEAFYAYDLAGNRTRTVINGETNVYTLGVGDRLADWGSGSYEFDAAGSVTTRVAGATSQSLAWDSLYRLTTVSTNGQMVESYQYDALDRRIATTTGTSTQWHLHSGPHIVADVDAAGNLLRSYTHGPGIDDLLTMTVHDGTNATTYAYVKDRMGTVLALVDEAGEIVESYDYDAWGNVLGVFDAIGDPIPMSVIGNRYLFQGRDYSWATGLYHFRARWYDPVTGRWLSKDPIGIAGGLNLYVAFENNPSSYYDYTGLEPENTVEDWYVRKMRSNPLEPFGITDEDLYTELKHYNRTRLKEVRYNLDLAGNKGDTRFKHFNSDVFIYKNQRFTGEEINYIGVGFGARHLGISKHNLRVAVFLNNHLQADRAKKGELDFALWGHDNYYKALKYER